MTGFSPSLDVRETDNEYRLHFDLPGVPEKDIKVEIKDNTLYVSGEKFREDKQEGEYVRYERVHGKFERAISIPRDGNAEKISANYENGVLDLVIPKKVGSDSRLIKVEKN